MRVAIKFLLRFLLPQGVVFWNIFACLECHFGALFAVAKTKTSTERSHPTT